VRVGIHASVIASPAIVTKVREVKDVTLGKSPTNLNSTKYRAIPFAVSASIAYD
jgi:hypothetical protein